MSLRRSDAAVPADLLAIREGYHKPYDLLDSPPEKVLVLGAGTGNDVAVALDRGAQQVDVVEIDPVIIELGRSLHPNRPYDDPRVRIFNTDARNFLNRPGVDYDLIVFGTLDSMTRLSALSSVRLDNFVYTIDGLQAARNRLAHDGGLAMYFMVGTDFIFMRLWGMLSEVFEEPPAVIAGNYAVFNRIFLAGPAFSKIQTEERAANAVSAYSQRARLLLPTDDWPFLYLESKSISGFYLSLIAVFLVMAVAVTLLVAAKSGGSRFRPRFVDWEMFLFGMAFLLLETKAITQINLRWGATWLTSAVVFGAILLMILLATLWSHIRPMNWRTAMAGLVIALLIGYLVPVNSFLAQGVALKLLGSFFIAGLPIFFAASCFAIVYAERENADLAFGWNLLGAVVGGFLEFLSMALGLKALTLIALIAYLFAALLRSRKKKGGTTGPVERCGVQPKNGISKPL